MTQSRIGTSSSAAETGVGSRFTSAVTLGPHPFFPPGCLLAAGKGPHLELALPGALDKAGEAGIPLFDLRSCRPGLPAKCKVYTLTRHPFRPDVVAAGTNIGVFVVAVAPQYSAAAAAVSHPLWRMPARCVDALDAPLDASQSNSSAGSNSNSCVFLREGAVCLSVTASGALVATQHALTSRASAHEVAELGLEQLSDGNKPPIKAPLRQSSLPSNVPSGSSRASFRGGAAAGGGGVSAGGSLELMSVEHVLLPSIQPLAAPPPTVTVPGSGGAGPTVNPNALAALTSLLKPVPGPPGSTPPPPLAGTRGVRLRVSGSGRHVAAIWPEHRCYAIYRLTFPALSSAAGSENAASSSASKQWYAEFVDGGQGLDVAWALTSQFDDKYSADGSGNSSSDTPAAEGVVEAEDDRPKSSKLKEEKRRQASAVAPPTDRFVMIEPGAAITGRGPMGGGMAIGTTPVPAKGGSSAAAKAKAAAAAAGAGAAVPTAPSTLTLKELPVPPPGDDSPALVKPRTLITRVGLSQEPVAVWGGPVLAVAQASDTGSAGANLGTASLQFLSWSLAAPLEQTAEEKAKEAALAARYSGLASEPKAREPRLLPVGSSSNTPAPSVAGAVNGHGVTWSSDGARAAVCSPSAVHILTSFPASASAASSLTVTELCRVPLQAASAVWGGDGGLYVTTTDARVVGVFPPVFDPTGLTDASAASSYIASRRLAPVVVELQALAPPPALPGGLHTTPLPGPSRGVLSPAMCAPLAVARDHLLTAHWTGRRMPPTSSAAAAGGAGSSPGSMVTSLPLIHPGLRAVRALASAGARAAASAAAGDAKQLLSQYRDGATAAAACGSLLPQSAQDALTPHLIGMGATAAALMLPGLCAESVTSLALAHRADVFAAAAASSSGGTRGVDASVAVAALLRMLRRVDVSTLIQYGQQTAGHTQQCDVDSDGSTTGSHPSSVDGSSDDDGATQSLVGWWPQVAAFLSVAATSYPHLSGAISTALRDLALRCKQAGLAADATLVAAVASRNSSENEGLTS